MDTAPGIERDNNGHSPRNRDSLIEDRPPGIERVNNGIERVNNGHSPRNRDGAAMDAQPLG